MQPLDLSDHAPWKRRYRVPVVGATQIAANNPSRGLAVCNQTGIYQLYAWAVPTGSLRQITDDPAGEVFGGISPDGRFIYYLEDDGGNEIGHFVRVPFEGGSAEDITPDMPPYASFSISQSLNGTLLGFTTAGKDGFNLYTMPAAPDGTLGRPQLLYHSSKRAVGPMLSHNADYAVIATVEHSQYNELSLMAFHIASTERQQTVRVLREEAGSIKPVGFSPLAGDTRFLANTDVTGFNRPVIWDARTGDRIDIPLADLDGDVEAWGWSDNARRILLCLLHQAVYQLYVYDLDSSLLHRLAHPGGTFSSGYFAPGGGEIFVNWQNATSPPQVIALDAETGRMTRTVLTVPLPDNNHLPPSRPWRSVHFVSSGSTPIQAWLATPKGEPPFPTILHTHGGPTAVMTETYHAEAQAWLDHGFAWMSVNYRGSTTFGREFEQAIWGRLGHDEIDDMAAAVHWLIQNGLSQPDAVLVAGRSYGGYLTLQALGRRPDLWAGGMATVAIADWGLMYEDQAETLRGYQRSLFGGTPDEVPEQTRASSPMTYVDAVRAPLLVIQGRNDTRCPARQMEAYEAKMRAAGKDIRIHWYDAGHSSKAMEQNIEHMALMLQFAYRVLG